MPRPKARRPSSRPSLPAAHRLTPTARNTITTANSSARSTPTTARGCASVARRPRATPGGLSMSWSSGLPQRLLHREQHARGVAVEIVVEALDGDIGELHAVDGADIGDHHVELAAIGSDLGVEAVEVLELADVARHAGDVQADRGDRLVQFVLTAGEDIDEGPFGDEPLCRGQSNPAGAAGNHGDLVL